MNLVTKEIEASLPPLYSTEEIGLPDKRIVLKFFNPTGRGTWFVAEGSRQEDGDLTFFGFVRGEFDENCDEWGYFSLRELAAVRCRFGLGIERDINFEPMCFKEIR